MTEKAAYAGFDLANLVRGQASPEGTAQFCEQSVVPLRHRWRKMGWTTTTLQCGLPLNNDRTGGSAERHVQTAVAEGMSNVFEIFDVQFDPRSLTFMKRALQSLLEAGMTRDQMVLTATVVRDPRSIKDVIKGIHRAKQVANVEVLDVALVQLSSEFMVAKDADLRLDEIQEDPLAAYEHGRIEEIVAILEDVASAGDIQTYGFDLPLLRSYAPECSAATTGDDLLFDYDWAVPLLVERYANMKEFRMDAVRYVISPTQLAPATMHFETTPRQRLPLTTFGTQPFYFVASDVNGDLSIDHYMMRPERDLRKLRRRLDDLCPALRSTPSIAEKAARVALSAGADIVHVQGDEMAWAELRGVSNLVHDDILSLHDVAPVFEGYDPALLVQPQASHT